MPLMTNTNPGTRPPTLPLLAEAPMVARRRMNSTARVATITHKHKQLVEEALTLERIEVEHVWIGRTIKAVPPICEAGDTTILSVWKRSS